MSSKSVESRLALYMALSGAVLAVLAATAVLLVSYHYLMGDVRSRITRLATDLQGEYAQFGGASEAFRRCVAEDAQEHNEQLTFILVTDPTNAVVASSHIPVGFRKHMLQTLARGRAKGRFLAARGAVEHTDRGAVRFIVLPLADGGRVMVARDVSSLEHFLIFLLATLAGGAFLIALLSSASGYVIGRRVLRLHRLIEEKNKAYGELRVLTDDIAHDLRTPLTRLRMAAETELTCGKLDVPLGTLVTEETSAMIDLINTMLEISQTDAKIDRTPREDLDLSDLVRHMAAIYSPAMEEAHLTFAVHTPAHPVFFSGHKGKIQQLLGNLIDNALKFTSAGGRVDLALEELEEALRITVSDTGCGIAPDDLPRLYNRFWRADSSRHLPGNGLGLALVKAIVTSYGGRIDCASALGRGTQFTLTIPRGCEQKV